jgi:hypothetical protein
MIYEVIGRLTVKAARYWISRKAPSFGALLAAAGVLGGLAIVAGLLVASGGEVEEEG